MINEVAQWVVLLSIVVLLLGVLRQIGLTLPPPSSGEPAGLPVGGNLPASALRQVRRALSSQTSMDSIVLAFVTEECRGCRSLLASIGHATASSNGSAAVAGDPHNGINPSVLVIARNPSTPFWNAIVQTGTPAVRDDGSLWKACHVTATPLLLRIESDGKVVAKGVTDRVETVTESRA